MEKTRMKTYFEKHLYKMIFFGTLALFLVLTGNLIPVRAFITFKLL